MGGGALPAARRALRRGSARAGRGPRAPAVIRALARGPRPAGALAAGRGEGGEVPGLVVRPGSGRAEVRLQPALQANPSRTSQGSFVEGAPGVEVLAVPALLDPTLQTGHGWSQTAGRPARWRGGGWLLPQNICRARIQPVSPTAQAPIWLVWIWG